MNIERFDEQLIDVTSIWLLTYSIRSIHVFVSQVPLILTDPIASEFEKVDQEMLAGAHMTKALENLAQRVPSPSLRLLVDTYLNSASSSGYLKLEDLDATLQTIWARHDPSTKPADSNYRRIMMQVEHLKQAGSPQQAEAIAQFLAMKERAIPYLIDQNSDMKRRMVGVINLLKRIGGDTAIKNLTRFRHFKWIEPGHFSILRAALEDLGIQTDIPPKFCWLCHAEVSEAVRMNSDRNPRAVFCSDDHLKEAEGYPVFWI